MRFGAAAPRFFLLASSPYTLPSILSLPHMPPLLSVVQPQPLLAILFAPVFSFLQHSKCPDGHSLHYAAPSIVASLSLLCSPLAALPTYLFRHRPPGSAPCVVRFVTQCCLLNAHCSHGGSSAGPDFTLASAPTPSTPMYPLGYTLVPASIRLGPSKPPPQALSTLHATLQPFLYMSQSAPHTTHPRRLRVWVSAFFRLYYSDFAGPPPPCFPCRRLETGEGPFSSSFRTVFFHSSRVLHSFLSALSYTRYIFCYLGLAPPPPGTPFSHPTMTLTASLRPTCSSFCSVLGYLDVVKSAAWVL